MRLCLWKMDLWCFLIRVFYCSEKWEKWPVLLRFLSLSVRNLPFCQGHNTGSKFVLSVGFKSPVHSSISYWDLTNVGIVLCWSIWWRWRDQQQNPVVSVNIALFYLNIKFLLNLLTHYGIFKSFEILIHNMVKTYWHFS